MVVPSNETDPFQVLEHRPNQLTALFEILPACLPRKYQGSRRRKLIVECGTTRSGRFPEFLVTIVGHPDEFRFDKAELDAYILRREIPQSSSGRVLMDSRNTAIECLEAGLIDILRTTGYGEIALVFTKGSFLCEVTFSHYRKESKESQVA